MSDAHMADVGRAGPKGGKKGGGGLTKKGKSGTGEAGVPASALRELEDRLARQLAAMEAAQLKEVDLLSSRIVELQGELRALSRDVKDAFREIEGLKAENTQLQRNLGESRQRETALVQERELELARKREAEAAAASQREADRLRKQRAVPMRGGSNWLSGYPSLEKFAQRSDDMVNLQLCETTQEALQVARARDRPIVALFVHNSGRFEMDAENALAIAKEIDAADSGIEFAILVMKMGDAQVSASSVKDLAAEANISPARFHIFMINYRQKDFTDASLRQLEHFRHLVSSYEGCVCCQH